MQQQQEVTRIHTNKLLNATHPVVNLPAEVLEAIFREACVGIDPRSASVYPYDAFDRTHHYIQKVRYSIMATCSRWCFLVNNTGSLWRMVPVRGKWSTLKFEFTELVEHLRRLHQARLSLRGSYVYSIQPEEWPEFTRLLLSKAQLLAFDIHHLVESRIEEAALLDVATPAPHLKKIHLNFPKSGVVNTSLAPLLQSLSLIATLYQPVELLLPPSSKLQTLHLAGIYPDNSINHLLVTLQGCASLETLYLGVDVVIEYVDHIIHLPSLRHLLLAGTEGSGCGLPLQQMNCPKLESLWVGHFGSHSGVQRSFNPHRPAVISRHL